ncbi:MAG: hypothetical protein LQ352_005473 [Teloschistes flavicans]|nr:MAG: hypothetical protein LQ352_005473 [Teloschistes flavicans]
MDSDLSTLALRFTDVDLLLAVSGRLQSGVNAGLERWCVLATVGEGVVGHVSVGEQIWFGKIVMMHCEKKAVTYWLAISIPESQKIICEVQDLYKVPNEIYKEGILNNKLPTVTTDPNKLEEQAKKHLGERSFNYVAGGAGERATMDANRLAFRQWKVRLDVWRASSR